MDRWRCSDREEEEVICTVVGVEEEVGREMVECIMGNKDKTINNMYKEVVTEEVWKCPGCGNAGVRMNECFGICSSKDVWGWQEKEHTEKWIAERREE